jgi:HAE1 family hydrophobic/amphiphilic exporter-1
MEKNHDIEKAREYGKSVQGRYVEERAAALPQLSLNGSVSLAQDDSQKALVTLAPRQYTRAVDLALSQPLYTWGRLGAAIRGAEVGLKTADEQLRLFRQAAWRDVSAAFYDILLAKELNKLAGENMAQKRRHLDEAQRKFASGTATDYDVLASEVAVENARPEVIRTENAIRTARERLRFLLAMEGEQVDATGTLAAAVETTAFFEEAMAIARRRRPELAERLLQMAEKGYEYGVKIRLEVDDAQLNLLQARSNLARAQRDYRVARVNYEWAMGVAGE